MAKKRKAKKTKIKHKRAAKKKKPLTLEPAGTYVPTIAT